jgi:hypothetical protein|tara:strand:+ start:14012 stop:14383 length:372 start_codon:yes stop_codon:yes gene_type:complete
MKEKLILDFQSWNIKQIDRSRDRMKLQIKLSKDEAQAFKNFMGMVKPPEIAEEDFLKGIFKIGVETMEMKLMEAVQKHAEEEGVDLENLPQETEEVTVPIVGEVSELKPSTKSSDEVQDSKTV